MQKEAGYSKKVVDEMNRRGYKFVKIAGSKYQKSGLSDIIGCLNGKYVAIETKRNYNKIEGLQLLELINTKKSGGFAFGVTVKEVQKVVLLFTYESNGMHADSCFTFGNRWYIGVCDQIEQEVFNNG